MADNPNTPPNLSESLSRGFRKWLFVFAGLFIFWIIFGQAIPRMMMPRQRDAGATAEKYPVQETVKEKDAQIAELTNRVDQLEAKMKALEEVIAASPKPSADTTATDAKIQALQEKIDALQSSEAAGESANDAHIEDELRGLKVQLVDMQSKHAHQLSALAAWHSLKDAIAHGGAFAAPLDQLSQLTPDNAKAQDLLKELAPFAITGAPTLTTLQNRFDALIPTALSSKEGSEGWSHKLQSLIRIRKVGGQQAGNDDESIIARAEAKLDKGDVGATTQELAALSPEATAAFAPWTAQAQQFLHVQTVIESLQPALIEDKPEPSAPTPVTAPVPTPSPALAPAPESPAPEPAPPAKSE